MAKKLKLNTVQLSTLRDARGLFGNPINCDRCTGKALVARGFAWETPQGTFRINIEGLVRAKYKADVVATPTSGKAPDPSLLEDLK